MLNSKSQTLSPKQIPNPNVQNFRLRCFRYWLLSGILCLALGIASKCYALNLDKAKVNFLKGNYQECINECENILAGSGYSKDLDELYYILGLSYLKQDNLLRASDIFEIIINEFKGSNFRDEALFSLGDIYFLKSDYEKAENNYKQILAINPNTKLESLIIFRLIQTSMKKGDWQEAKAYSEKLNKDYPSSFIKRMSADLSSRDFYFTVQVGAFSKPINAENLCRELNQKGYSAFIQTGDQVAAKTYRVRVGKLNTALEAKELEAKLKNEGYPTKIYP